MADPNMLFLGNLVACLQLNLLLINHLMLTHSRRMSFLKALVHFSPPCVGFRRRTQKKRRPRRFWVRPGRTSAWWDNFESNTMLPEEWKENFRMSRSSLVRLSEELRPYIEGKSTRMRQPVDVMKKVACTLYYLSDEGRMRKTANAFGLSRQVVSKIVREVSTAITKYLGPVYIKPPFTEAKVTELVTEGPRYSTVPWGN